MALVAVFVVVTVAVVAVVHWAALGDWIGLGPSRVASVVAAWEEREVALSSTVGWLRTSPFVVELLKLGTAETLMVAAALAVAMWSVAVYRVAVEAYTRFCFHAWVHASVQIQRDH